MERPHSQNPKTAPPATHLRADAQANHDLLVEAARELFSTHGIDVPLSTIARRAGVSAATLYRRFPAREALVAEVFAEQLGECESLLERCQADEDPGRGLRRLLMTITDMQARSRGFSGALLARYPGAIDLDATRERADHDLRGLVRRAQDAGALRPDFDHTDVYLLLLAVDALAAQPPEIAQAAARRLVAYVLQAARPGRAAPLPPPAPLELAVLHQDQGR
ncbi:TetR/AcrR family transcriptional regulator [Brachybacterium sp. FME24]|uniref:TetR/AcrR family transcriptional regulator n=1 Tax=Brachybacterium sp. FME24 TaxID=2742605 RepID=UPI0018694A19|nr:TetR/AcrR family transcriptional regulator [Brachybacterium sp. FME24]